MTEPMIKTGPVDSPDSTGVISSSSATTRRWLLRGGAVAAGAAVVAAAAPGVAHADDGDPVNAGELNDTTSTTSLRVGGTAGAPTPTLGLENAEGPSLYLQPLDADFGGTLELGQLANTVLGPIISVDTEVGLTTTFLATGVDLADLPTPYAMPTPVRLLDTRRESGRAGILRTSTDPFDAAGRLKAAAWIDVEVTPVAGDFEIPAVYLNILALSPPTNGFLTVYRPPTYPNMSTLRFTAKQSISNLAIVATGIVLGRYAVWIRASAPTYVIADLTGFTVKGDVPTPAGQSADGQGKRTAKQRAAVVSRLRSTLTQRIRHGLGG